MVSRTGQSGEPKQVLGAPEEQHASLRLLVEYEEIIGPLRKLEGKAEGEWPWSWSPEEAKTFVSEWERPIYVLNEMLRELAFTVMPGSRKTVLDQSATAEIREKIEKIMDEGNLSVGSIPPVPTGTYSIDLRPSPLFMRPAIFRINEWHFSGYVTNISRGLRDQLAEIHGRWYSEGMRVFAGTDHPTQDIGEIRRGA